MTIKLLATDLDGTLLRGGQPVSAGNIAAAQAAAKAGTIVTIATGRMYRAAMPVAEAFGLDVPMDAAEQAKRRFVFSLDYQDKTEVLRTAAGSKKVSHQAISYIIEARAGELAGMIRREMEQLGVNLDARPAVYVSGGGLLMMRG